MSFQFENLYNLKTMFKANLGHDWGHLGDTVYAHVKDSKINAQTFAIVKWFIFNLERIVIFL
jgi:hypothetical protein